MKNYILFIAFLLCSIPVFTQTYSWSNRYGGTGLDQVYASVGDNSGHVYVTGTFTNTVDFDPGSGVYNLTSSGVPVDIFLAKYTTAGTLVWAFSLGMPSANDYSNEIALDPSGNIIITGTSGNTMDFDPTATTNTGIGSGDMFMAKYTPAGALIWGFRIGSVGSGESWDIATDKTGAIYWTGMCQYTTDFDPGAGTANILSSGLKDIFVAKYDAGGNYQWAFKLGTTGTDYAKSLAVDTLNNVYVTGGFSTTIDFNPGAGTNNLTSTGAEDIFLAKYTSAGNYVWAFKLGGGAADYGLDVTIDRDQNVWMSGEFYGTVDFDPGAGTSNMAGVGSDLFAAKYSKNGNYLRSFRAGGSSGESASGITTDKSGNVYITGMYYSTSVDMDPGAGTANLPNAGQSDIFAAKYDSLANYTWAFRVAGSGNDSGKKIAVDTSNNVYLNGWFQTAIDCDPSAGSAVLTTAGSYDGFFSVYNQLPCIAPDVPTITADATICEGDTVTLQILSGNLNSATQWQWYTGSCGSGTFINADSIVILPSSTTSYFVRGIGGCISSGSCTGVTITVNSAPTINFTQSPNETCIDGGIVPISAATPTGGIFSGTGVSGTNFDPLAAGAGVWPINYSYTDVNGCNAQAMQNITVYDLPNVVYNEMTEETCIDAPPFFITNGTPFGGSYTGNGLTGGTFTAASAGAGTHIIEYFYTDGNGCMNSDTSSITVHNLPTVNFSVTPNSVCVNDNLFPLSGGTPAGGSYSGNGVSFGNFNPASAGVGTHTISYTYADPVTGCENTATSSILVDQCLGINDSGANEVFIFPNPANDLIFVKHNTIPGTISVFNSLGEMVINTFTNSTETSINVSELSNGIYFISIRNTDTFLFEKILIAR